MHFDNNRIIHQTLQLTKSGLPFLTVTGGNAKSTNYPFIFVNYRVYYKLILSTNIEYLLVYFK